MALKVNYLSVDFSIGGHQLSLETTKLPTKADAQGAVASLKDSVKALILNQTYKMEEGLVITVSLKQFFATISEKIPDGLQAVKEFFAEVSSGADGLNIELWDIFLETSSEGTSGSFRFGFKVKVLLTKKFYDNLNVPSEVTNIISLDGLGLGVAFDKTVTVTPYGI